MPTWDEIKSRVESNDNVVTVTMEELRGAMGAGKLGVHIRAEISKQLAGMGLGHVPKELPSYQHEQVRLFKFGTPVGELIVTVLNPGEQNDKKLAGQVGTEAVDYADIIARVRELVAE